MLDTYANSCWFIAIELSHILSLFVFSTRTNSMYYDTRVSVYDCACCSDFLYENVQTIAVFFTVLGIRWNFSLIIH